MVHWYDIDTYMTERKGNRTKTKYADDANVERWSRSRYEALSGLGMDTHRGGLCGVTALGGLQRSYLGVTLPRELDDLEIL